MTSTFRKIQTFELFWPYYLSQHQMPWTRRLHALGTSFGVAIFSYGAYQTQWKYCLYSLLVGYGTAWFSHLFVEKNRPATWLYPWWSLRADFKLLLLMVFQKR